MAGHLRVKQIGALQPGRYSSGGTLFEFNVADGIGTALPVWSACLERAPACGLK